MYKNIIVRVTRKDELKHSAKGSTWKDHKYIKKVGDKYVYADTQNGSGDSTESTSGSNSSTDTDTEKTSENSQEEFDLDEMAKKVIRGEFGNGADRKELLGDSYADIQKRVNEMLKSDTTVSKDNIDTGKKAVNSIIKRSSETLVSASKKLKNSSNK